MPNLPLTLACWNYDRTRALADGTVRAKGIDLTYLSLPVEETFFRMLRYREFDAAEMSLSSYVVSLFSEARPFIAIPAFVSRFFRHASIFVNAAAGIREPQDLIGRRVGSPEYQMTAPVWIRGILSDQYGVGVEQLTHLTGGEEQPNRSEKLKLDLPRHIKVEPIGPRKTLSRMLAEGEIDALFTARAPSSFRDGSGRVRRLFENYEEVEREYFHTTGIFPIMHVVVVRRDIHEASRWVARSLYEAFLAAQRLTYEDLAETAAQKAMLPWAHAHFETARREMGEDYWPYGVERNRATLDTFLRYSFEQGLSKRQLSADELFAPETLESFKI